MTFLMASPPVVVLRSLLFHIASAVTTIAFLLLWPLILAPRAVVWSILRVYIRTQLLLLRLICGQSYRVRGLENLPQTPCIIAARHQAMWETLVLPLLFDNPAVILKDDILGYPIAGRVARKLGFIGVDRGGALDRAKASFDQARAELAAGRSVLIFPGGTRDPAHRDRLQPGVAVLYRMLKTACLPVTLNSGTFWPHKSWLRRPGCIEIELLSPIEPGLRSSTFMERLDSELTGAESLRDGP